MPIISFGEDEEERAFCLYEDALVITILIANFTTRRILVNNGNSADILFWEAFTQIRIDLACLRPTPMPLKGDIVQPIGTITLSILAGEGPLHSFSHGRLHSGKGSLICGRPILKCLRVVMSTYHLQGSGGDLRQIGIGIRVLHSRIESKG